LQKNDPSLSAATYIWSGRSLIAPIAGHSVANLMIEPWLLLYTITFYAKMFSQ
jgi:hypothetical protein